MSNNQYAFKIQFTTNECSYIKDTWCSNENISYLSVIIPLNNY